MSLTEKTRRNLININAFKSTRFFVSVQNSKIRAHSTLMWWCLILKQVKTKIKDIMLSGFRSYSRPNFLYTQDDINTLNNLKNDNNIIITKPDKGNGIVILNKDNYNRKMDKILFMMMIPSKSRYNARTRSSHC